MRRLHRPAAATLAVLGASLSLTGITHAAATADDQELKLEQFARDISVASAGASQPAAVGAASVQAGTVGAVPIQPAPAAPPQAPKTAARAAREPRTVAEAAREDEDRSAVEVLAERLDALQRRNDQQQAEINRLRSQVGGIASAESQAGTAAPRSVALAAVPPVVPGDGRVAAPSAGSASEPTPTPGVAPAAVAQAPGGGAQAAIPAGAAPAAAGQPNAPAQVAIVNDATQTQSVQKPADSSVESVYQQQNALFRRNLTLTPSLTRAYSDNSFVTLNGFLALGAIFLGNVNVTQQHTDLTIAALNATYGLTNRFQLDGTIPYFNRSTNFASVGENNSSSQPSQDTVTNSGIGDTVLGAFYQLRPESNVSPGITLNGHVSVPTGRAPYGIKLVSDPVNDNLQFPGRLPTGSGVFGAQLGASFVKTADPVVWFGGANYYYNFRGHFADLSTAANTVTPGFAQPGNTLQYQLGTAFALNERTSLSFAFSDAISNQVVLFPTGGPAAPVIGSETNAAMLSISTGFASNPHQTVVTEFDLGLTKDAPNFQIDMRFPHRF